MTGCAATAGCSAFNSFGAYFVFTVLLCASFYFLYAVGRARPTRSATRRWRARDAALARADAAQRELAARARADRAAAELLELLRQRRHREAIAAERNLDEVELGAAQRQFLSDAVPGARVALAADATAPRAPLLRSARLPARPRRGRGRARLAAGGGPEVTGARGRPALRAGRVARLAGPPAEAISAYGAFLAAAPDHALAPRARQRVAWLERIKSRAVGAARRAARPTRA